MMIAGRLAVAVGALMVAVALPGCGKEESGFASVPSVGGEDFEGAARSNVEIKMKGIAFSPQRVKLAKGATVTWTNDDQVDHTVTQGNINYNRFTSGEVAPGQTYSRTFNKPGEIAYRCVIHANMGGVFRVTG